MMVGGGVVEVGYWLGVVGVGLVEGFDGVVMDLVLCGYDFLVGFVGVGDLYYGDYFLYWGNVVVFEMVLEDEKVFGVDWFGVFFGFKQVGGYWFEIVDLSEVFQIDVIELCGVLDEEVVFDDGEFVGVGDQLYGIVVFVEKFVVFVRDEFMFWIDVEGVCVCVGEVVVGVF